MHQCAADALSLFHYAFVCTSAAETNSMVDWFLTLTSFHIFTLQQDDTASVSRGDRRSSTLVVVQQGVWFVARIQYKACAPICVRRSFPFTALRQQNDWETGCPNARNWQLAPETFDLGFTRCCLERRGFCVTYDGQCMPLGCCGRARLSKRMRVLNLCDYE